MTRGSWSPATLPENVRLSRDQRSVMLPHATRPTPTPQLSDELATWQRPNASACFPLHPLGVIELFRRASELVGQTPAVASRSDEELRHLSWFLWVAASELFEPGAAIRTELDSFCAKPPPLPGEVRELDDGGRLAARRLALLCAWAVVTATREWAGEAK